MNRRISREDWLAMISYSQNENLRKRAIRLGVKENINFLRPIVKMSEFCDADWETFYLSFYEFSNCKSAKFLERHIENSDGLAKLTMKIVLWKECPKQLEKINWKEEANFFNKLEDQDALKILQILVDLSFSELMLFEVTDYFIRASRHKYMRLTEDFVKNFLEVAELVQTKGLMPDWQDFFVRELLMELYQRDRNLHSDMLKLVPGVNSGEVLAFDAVEQIVLNAARHYLSEDLRLTAFFPEFWNSDVYPKTMRVRCLGKVVSREAYPQIHRAAGRILISLLKDEDGRQSNQELWNEAVVAVENIFGALKIDSTFGKILYIEDLLQCSLEQKKLCWFGLMPDNYDCRKMGLIEICLRDFDKLEPCEAAKMLFLPLRLQKLRESKFLVGDHELEQKIEAAFELCCSGFKQMIDDFDSINVEQIIVNLRSIDCAEDSQIFVWIEKVFALLGKSENQRGYLIARYCDEMGWKIPELSQCSQKIWRQEKYFCELLQK